MRSYSVNIHFQVNDSPHLLRGRSLPFTFEHERFETLSSLHKLLMSTQQPDISDSTARTGKEGVAGDTSILLRLQSRSVA
jgi:hypothetical protein